MDISNITCKEVTHIPCKTVLYVLLPSRSNYFRLDRADTLLSLCGGYNVRVPLIAGIAEDETVHEVSVNGIGNMDYTACKVG